MNPWAESLGPVIITSFAIQQLLELTDPFLERFLKSKKAMAHSFVAFLVALSLSLLLDLRALRPFGLTRMPWLDTLLTALLITGGTKWVNDLVKVMSYRKNEIRLRSARQEAESAGGCVSHDGYRALFWDWRCADGALSRRRVGGPGL